MQPPPPPPYAYPPPPGVPYGAAPGPPYGGPPRGTNGFAIASLVCSIVGCGVGSVLGIVFGHIARGQIRRTAEGGNGLAIAGLVVGYLGLLAAAVALVAFVFLFSNQGNRFARDDAREFDRRVTGYARLVGSTPRDARVVDRALRSCCLSTVTIGDTGLPARGASATELAAAGWQLQFNFLGEPGSGHACLTVPAVAVARDSDVRDGRCGRPASVAGGV
jgi:hypothetical protein